MEFLENENGYRHFTQLPIAEETYEDLLRTVGTLGDWAGDAAIYAMSNVLQRPLQIYQEFPNAPSSDAAFEEYLTTGQRQNHRRFLFDGDNADRRAISIHYRSAHFVALLPLGSTDFQIENDQFAAFRRFGY